MSLPIWEPPAHTTLPICSMAALSQVRINSVTLENLKVSRGTNALRVIKGWEMTVKLCVLALWCLNRTLEAVSLFKRWVYSFRT